MTDAPRKDRTVEDVEHLLRALRPRPLTEEGERHLLGVVGEPSPQSSAAWGQAASFGARGKPPAEMLAAPAKARRWALGRWRWAWAGAAAAAAAAAVLLLLSRPSPIRDQQSPPPAVEAMSEAEVDRYIAREAIAARLVASARIMAGEMDSPRNAERVRRYVEQNYGDTSAAKQMTQPQQ